MEISDNQLLYISSLVCLALALFFFKDNKQAGVINLVVLFLYSGILYYNLIYNSDGGSGFLWWFYLVILTILHVLIIGIYIVIKYFKKKTAKVRAKNGKRCQCKT
jgi:hypothetical protein